MRLLTMTPNHQDTPDDLYSTAIGVAGGAAVIVVIFTWFGLTAPGVLALLLVYLVITVPLVFLLSALRLKRQGRSQPADETNNSQRITDEQ
jgi:peptidoglycan/LPS O-acetylase OafA/YrhL